MTMQLAVCSRAGNPNATRTSGFRHRLQTEGSSYRKPGAMSLTARGETRLLRGGGLEATYGQCRKVMASWVSLFGFAMTATMKMICRIDSRCGGVFTSYRTS